MIDLGQAKDLSTIIGVAIALITLIRGVVEYRRQGAQKRVEHFLTMRLRMKEDSTFKEIFDLLERDDPSLAVVPFKDKRDILGYFEEIALMMASGLIRPAVAHYMFGYYAIRCDESIHFWSNVNRRSPYWSLFTDFALQMKAIEKGFTFKRYSLRF